MSADVLPGFEDAAGLRLNIDVETRLRTDAETPTGGSAVSSVQRTPSARPISRFEIGKSQPVKGRYRNSDIERSFDTGHFAACVRTFANLLPPDELARVRSRRRFHSMPYLRLSHEPNPEDILP